MDQGLRKILLFITGGLFLISGVVILPFVVKDSTSRNWPTVTAVIKRCDVIGKHLKADDPKYLLDVEYEYKVGNQMYTSTNYGTFDRLSSRSERAMIDMKKEYPVNGPITIAYDPDRHSYALIHPGIVWYHVAGLAIVAFWGACFAACILFKGKAPE